MKIKFTEKFIGAEATYEKGETYDVEDVSRARTYVRSGMAKAVDPLPDPVAAEKEAAAKKSPAVSK